MRYFKLAALAFTALAGLSGAASAADPAACETIRLSDPGWTDITSTNSVASVLLEGLGYKPDVKTMSVPIRSEEHTSELQSRENLVCRLLLEKKKTKGT